MNTTIVQQDLNMPATSPFEVKARAPFESDSDLILRRPRFHERPLLVYLARLVVLTVFLLAWEFSSGLPADPSTLIDEYFVSKPSSIAASLMQFWQSGALVPAVLATFEVTMVGFLLAVACGILVGFLFAVNAAVAAIFEPFMTMLYSVPRVALIPLFLLWFGLGIGSKVAVVFSIVFFLVFNSTYAGMKDVKEELIDTLRLMGAKRRHVYLKVMFPAALVWIVAGLRTSVPYALVGAVTAEMLASNRGIGALVMRAAGQFDTSGVFAAIMVLVCMSLVLMLIVDQVEKYLLRWKKV